MNTDDQNTHETRLSVRLKGPLAYHADQKVSSNLYESHSEYIRDLIRRDIAESDQYDLREGIIQGYADIAAGRFSDKSNDEIFAQAMQELRDEGYDIPEE